MQGWKELSWKQTQCMLCNEWKISWELIDILTEARDIINKLQVSVKHVYIFAGQQCIHRKKQNDIQSVSSTPKAH